MQTKRHPKFLVVTLILALALVVGSLAAAAQQQGAIILRVGSNAATVGDRSLNLDVAPTIIDGRTMVPLRFVAEALGAQVDWDGATQTITIQPPGAAAAVPPPDPGVREIKVEVFNFGWDPGEIVVNKGEKVRLVISNNPERRSPGLVAIDEPVVLEHGFRLDDYGIRVDLPPGETTVVEFVADKAGEFEFRCGVYCGNGDLADGRRLGHSQQRGKLIVR